MIIKPLKVKMRNGELFNLSHIFKTDNYIELSWNWYSFGLGFNYFSGDTRRYVEADFAWLHFSLWV